MKPFFITSKVNSIKYIKGAIVVNNPINISNCTSITKSRFAWYPDNTGRPAITFKGCEEEWVFDTEKDRDADFDRISSNSFYSGAM